MSRVPVIELEPLEWAEYEDDGVKGERLSGLGGNIETPVPELAPNEVTSDGLVDEKNGEVVVRFVGTDVKDNGLRGESTGESVPVPGGGGLMRFSFCLLLQNQTLTTSFSIHKELPNIVISSDVGLGFDKKALSSATRVLVSILVRFFLRRPLSESGVEWALFKAVGLLRDASASSSHRWSNGFNLHIFLKLRFRASKRDIVV